MPFAYYGAKHKLAGKYPVPMFGTIVEPFAGSAGYACRWGAGRRVVLVERDPFVVGLWRRLQGMSAVEVDRVVEGALGSVRSAEPLVVFCGGSASVAAVCAGKDQVVTSRMRKDAPRVAARVKSKLEMIRGWEIVEGDFWDAPDVVATWFVDPPYQPLGSQAGDGYRFGSGGLDYGELAGWCRSRRGQVLVCEQSPAAWLPFKLFARQLNGSSMSQSMRTEVLWQQVAG